MNDKLKEVSLTEMLDAREARAFAQKQLLNRYQKPLICLTLNIPGPVKVLPGVPQAFEEACRRIETILKVYQTPVLYNVSIREKTGYEAIYCVDDSPEAIKSRMTSLEDADRLGRLFDIDVPVSYTHLDVYKRQGSSIRLLMMPLTVPLNIVKM